MQERLTIIHKKIQSLRGYCPVHAITTVCTATLDSNPTYYVLKDSPTKAHHRHPQRTISQYNLLNSHTQMTDSHKNNKIQKYQPLINDITQTCWKIDPLMVITTRGTTHAPSMKQLKQTFKLSEISVGNTFQNINTNAIHYASSILLHKRQIENNQAIPIE